jgi:hypothetical protein
MQTERTLSDLTRDLAANAGDLVRNEIRLARAEAMDGIKHMGAGLARAAMGVALAAAALTLALFALAYALSEAMPMWIAALIGAVVGGLIAYLLIKSGLKAASVKVGLPRTAEQVALDLRTIKENVTS